jgi:FAD/FMN-containing dehydrogenase
MSASDYDEAVREGFAYDWRAAYSEGFETAQAQSADEIERLRAARDLAESRERKSNRRSHEWAASTRSLKAERDRAVAAAGYAARFLRAAFVDNDEAHVKPEWIDDLLERLEAANG